MVHSARVEVETRGEGEVLDLTPHVVAAIAEAPMADGLVNVFVVGSTAAVTTIEFEPGLVHDLGQALERYAPRDAFYEHEARWHDDNGHSHVRASTLGPSVTVPFGRGALRLGTWQQVVLVECDTRPRRREVLLTMVGD